MQATVGPEGVQVAPVPVKLPPEVADDSRWYVIVPDPPPTVVELTVSL